MRRLCNCALFFPLVAASLLVAGCGSGLDLVSAGGTVTMDGSPLAGATVEFQPLASGGSPSYGLTDEAGAYTLKFSLSETGVAIGDHTVRIYVETEGDNAKQPVPARYNAQSELTAKVEKGGSKTFDFDLQSQ